MSLSLVRVKTIRSPRIPLLLVLMLITTARMKRNNIRNPPSGVVSGFSTARPSRRPQQLQQQQWLPPRRRRSFAVMRHRPLAASGDPTTSRRSIDDDDDSNNDNTQTTTTTAIYRSMADSDLYTAWLDLVRRGHVVTTTTVPVVDGDGHERTCHVRYGVQRATVDTSCTRGIDQTQSVVCQDFVHQVMQQKEGDDDDDETRVFPHPTIQAMNATLQAMHRQSDTTGVRYAVDEAGFVVQLQLIRTLRPPAAFSSSSKGAQTIGGGGGGSSSSTPPPYDYDRDSFVTGPLRLPLRPRVARLDLPPPPPDTRRRRRLYTPWDVYHNVSPADPRGHFLLLPTLHDDDDADATNGIHRDDDDDNNNCRHQRLTREDCHDLVQLTATIRPVGSLLVCFNSVGAGASQNHIHCHAWPSPPLPFVVNTATTAAAAAAVTGTSSYAVCQTRGLYDFVDLCDDEVEVSFLDYPCCCFLLSATAGHANNDEDSLTVLGNVLDHVLKSIGDAPHNVCFLNRRVEEDIDENDPNVPPRRGRDNAAVDVYVFIRSREHAFSVVPSLKLGASEMMGLFHAQSEQEIQALCPEPVQSLEDAGRAEDHSHDHSHGHQIPETKMQAALREISYEPRHDLWESVKEKLVQEFGN